MNPIHTSKNSNKKAELDILKYNRKIQKPKFKLGLLVRTADKKKVFSKGDSTNWSYKKYTITEVIHDPIPSYRINYLSERYNQNLLLSTKLTLDEKTQVMKELNLIQ